MENIVATISEISTGKIGYDIAFPHLGIFIENLKNTFKIGNYTIAYYGVIIAIGMLIGFYVSVYVGKKINVNEDVLYDIFIICVLLGVIGARAYYVLFRLDYYTIRPYEILDIRGGGLAVFGGIILGTCGIIIYCLIKKINILKVMDATMFGVVVGQAIGRYGNFFNMEAFGDYTDNIFAMRLDNSTVTFKQTLNTIEENGVRYIQAHPTFLYESTLNILLLVIMFVILNKMYKFNGQTFATYLIGYGIIRFFVEALRTDSLMFYNFKVSQIVALICILVGVGFYIYNFIVKKIIKK